MRGTPTQELKDGEFDNSGPKLVQENLELTCDSLLRCLPKTEWEAYLNKNVWRRYEPNEQEPNLGDEDLKANKICNSKQSGEWSPNPRQYWRE